MSKWRLIGECRQGKSREEIRAQSIDGWNPWRQPWTRLREPDIVLLHHGENSRWCHIHIYEAEWHGAMQKFAAETSGESWRFYVPAENDDYEAVRALEARIEGHWRDAYEHESELPWPTPEEKWTGRKLFLQSLELVEKKAERIAYRGYSLCRLCGCMNGFEGLRLVEWEWPTGYRHYVVNHDVQPSKDFEGFILSRGLH